ncbi:MAG: hypothetical protein H0W64_04850 [Gammaproteobacteria bacterium]|nr:hypothetical protein [Gammaproteobacteria bacterium]
MSNDAKFLSSLYRDETITSIIEEAINGKFQLTFIDRDKDIERVLSRGDLSAIRDKGFSKKAEVEIEAPSSRLIAGNDWLVARREIVSFGRRQNVGYSDLRADEKNLSLIEQSVGCENKHLMPLLTMPVKKAEEQAPLPQDELTEEEANEERYKKPADCDQRLFNDAVKMKMVNPNLNLSQIHNDWFTQEKGKSDISIDSLKRIVKLADINSEIRKRKKLSESQSEGVNWVSLLH